MSSNPTKEINWDILDTALAYAANLKDVRYQLEKKGIVVCEKTIQRAIQEKHGLTFSDYREYQLAGTRLKLIQTALTMAFDKDRTMLIFCLKNICKWADRTETTHELTDDAKEGFKLAYAIRD
jgi:hypothetical protein